MTRRNLWKEQDEEARIWREELGWVGKIAYILLAVVLPIAAAILTPWLAEQIAAREQAEVAGACTRHWPKQRAISTPCADALQWCPR